MIIILNNREEYLTGDNISIDEMLEQKKFSFRLKVIKINGIFIPRENYASTVIHDGDNVQMLYLMSGG